MQYKKQVSIAKFRRLIKRKAALTGNACLFSPGLDSLTVLESFRYCGCVYVHYLNSKGLGVFARYKNVQIGICDTVIFIPDSTRIKL